MQRVLVIGSPGAGKSTLSRHISARTGLPVHHLDRIHWLRGWVERDRDEAGAMVAEVLAQDRWIIDGNYGSTMPQRIGRADAVVWLDYPTHLCLRRALGRWWQYRGTHRPDMTEGCPERLDPEFFLYVLNFRRAWQRRNAETLRGFAGPIIRHRSPRETEAWLAGL